MKNLALWARSETAGFAKNGVKNPKHQYLTPKQCQKIKIQITLKQDLKHAADGHFGF